MEGNEPTRSRALSVWFGALRHADEALLACVPLVTVRFISASSATGDPCVLSCPAHDLPCAEGDVASRLDVPWVDPLVLLSNREGSPFSGQRPGDGAASPHPLSFADYLRAADLQPVATAA